MQSFSDRWIELANQQGINVRKVDVFSVDLCSQVRGCDGFMWRYGYAGAAHRLAKRLLIALKQGMGMPVFPSWKTSWHFEDKIAQHYLLQAAGIPTPRTWVFWDRESALQFCRDARYPLVMKLAQGFQSMNVHLVRTAAEAEHWVHRMFGSGLSRFVTTGVASLIVRRPLAAFRVLVGKPAFWDAGPDSLQHGYFYVQEFLPNNAFDTRITVIGNRAFGFRRFNRPGDFRASGSGRIDSDRTKIDHGMIRLAFRVAQRLGTQSVAIDGLFRGDERTIGEISYTYASWAVRDCPGHWVLAGDPEDGRLDWMEGTLRPEDAIFEDFIAEVRARRKEDPVAHGGAWTSSYYRPSDDLLSG